MPPNPLVIPCVGSRPAALLEIPAVQCELFSALRASWITIAPYDALGVYVIGGWLVNRPLAHGTLLAMGLPGAGGPRFSRCLFSGNGPLCLAPNHPAASPGERGGLVLSHTDASAASRAAQRGLYCITVCVTVACRSPSYGPGPVVLGAAQTQQEKMSLHLAASGASQAPRAGDRQRGKGTFLTSNPLSQRLPISITQPSGKHSAASAVLLDALLCSGVGVANGECVWFL